MSQTCLQLETDFLRRKVIKCSLLTKATKAVLYHALLYMYYRQAPWQNQLINNLERFRTPKPHKRLAFKASVECWQAIHFTDYIIIEFLFFSESYEKQMIQFCLVTMHSLQDRTTYRCIYLIIYSFWSSVPVYIDNFLCTETAHPVFLFVTSEFIYSVLYLDTLLAFWAVNTTK